MGTFVVLWYTGAAHSAFGGGLMEASKARLRRSIQLGCLALIMAAVGYGFAQPTRQPIPAPPPVVKPDEAPDVAPGAAQPTIEALIAEVVKLCQQRQELE